jgi:hypothetical protein
MQVFGGDQGIVDYLKGVSLSDENVVDQKVVGENKSEGKKPMDDKPDDEKNPEEKKSEEEKSGEKKPVTADGGKGKKDNALKVPCEPAEVAEEAAFQPAEETAERAGPSSAQEVTLAALGIVCLMHSRWPFPVDCGRNWLIDGIVLYSF